ncbi:hypothetical protein [Muriicola soli]|uniref:Uncharacterized protein n=1 Tax=Muriicola soli TaxID=2507538 RepID=A0A411E7H7_9FLAO|nr:hypothetical protein [Muriicola soli]QBA63665.1 hypothetical protein EQY75_03345 [Muriicola soli]
MNGKDLAKQLKYSSSNSLLIITWNNLLKQLYCPFKVSVLRSVGTLKKGQIVWVEQVNVTMELKTVFVVEGSAYYFYYFDILID